MAIYVYIYVNILIYLKKRSTQFIKLYNENTCFQKSLLKYTNHQDKLFRTELFSILACRSGKELIEFIHTNFNMFTTSSSIFRATQNFLINIINIYIQ